MHTTRQPRQYSTDVCKLHKSHHHHHRQTDSIEKYDKIKLVFFSPTQQQKKTVEKGSRGNGSDATHQPDGMFIHPSISVLIADISDIIFMKVTVDQFHIESSVESI